MYGYCRRENPFMELGVNGKSKASGQTPYDVPGVRKFPGTTAAMFRVPEEILVRTVFVLTKPCRLTKTGQVCRE